MARLMDLSLHRRRMLGTMFFIFSVVLVLLTILEGRRRPVVRRGHGRRLLHRLVRGARVRADFINEATKFSNRSSIKVIRMDMAVFDKLCKVLVDEGGLRRTHTINIDEMVVMFLHTLGHNVKNRILQKKVGRSGKTVCAVIHAVLTSILRLHRTLYRKAVPVPNHSQHVYWKHFKNCLGALDGTHVNVRTKIQDQPRYRNRKGDVSINVLVVCNPDGEFIYCLAGWEGSAHDARVLRDVLSRPNRLKVPKGQYYLCDAGYANTEGFLAPFRGQRYHLKEFGGSNRPNTPEEYFNMKHSSARNVIERMFDLLKMRWGILRDTTWFSPEVVGRIVHACCLLHNFIRQEAGVDGLERAYNQRPLSEPATMAEEMEEVSSSMQPSLEWTNFRNQKAQQMWQNRTRQ